VSDKETVPARMKGCMELLCHYYYARCQDVKKIMCILCSQLSDKSTEFLLKCGKTVT